MPVSSVSRSTPRRRRHAPAAAARGLPPARQALPAFAGECRRADGKRHAGAGAARGGRRGLRRPLRAATRCASTIPPPPVFLRSHEEERTDRLTERAARQEAGVRAAAAEAALRATEERLAAAIAAQADSGADDEQRVGPAQHAFIDASGPRRPRTKPSTPQPAKRRAPMPRPPCRRIVVRQRQRDAAACAPPTGRGRSRSPGR